MNRLFCCLVLLFFFGFTAGSGFPVYAAPAINPCNLSIDNADRKIHEIKYGPCPAGLDQFEAMVSNLISIIVGLGFIAMLVMVIMAGIKYLTSGGEPKAVQAAHFTLTWALLGLLFFALAWLILQLIAQFTGIDITVFDIKTLCGDKATLPFCKPGP